MWQLTQSPLALPRAAARKSLIEYARERLSGLLALSGASPEAVDTAKHLFDPNTLTLGFARRFATYKRPNLLLHDPERLLRLLTNPVRPVQLIIAGKAHPADEAGQALIREWIRFIRQPETRSHVMFLSDYDMLLAEQLVQGVDVWINTPRRPWEASGTSGMKVLVNGGLNLSELDGWWAEAYTPDVGWALGDGKEHGDDPAWDAIEAEALYDLLEREVVPGLEGPRRYHARVAANVVAIVAREIETEEAQLQSEWERLGALLGLREQPPIRRDALRDAVRERTQALVARIRRGDADRGAWRVDLIAHLRRTVADKLAVSRPPRVTREESP